MSEDSNSKAYLFASLEGQDEAAGPSTMAQLHHMGGFTENNELGVASEGSDSSSQDHPTSPRSDRKMARSLHEEDVEMKSSGSSGSGTESHGNESRGNESHGNVSSGSSNSRSKDSALLELSGSNKSSNSHSPSPPSSSNAFSLLSASSEQDNPSTSGCSSEESAKAKTQKELIKTLKELKLHLPPEKRSKGNKSTTLNTLKYALRCVKEVEANEEYYQLLMINDSQLSGLDVSSYTIEEIDSITSEYTLKNTDIFAVAVSLITGKIIYISDQAAYILNCKREVFKNAKFVEFLTPQDVSVFYSFTTPYRLPSWSMCTGAESSPSDCMQEKSFFCRISGGKECEGDLQYYPFRMTPYLMKVQDIEHNEDQFCCLLLAERVHSGYEAPRIPTDKRIFTTTHTPSCVFQDVDERAVPLLGYLPQDLIGTPVLLHLHPNDRPIMLGIHRKILQYAGQPFDHSSIRFCTRNGEYITIDTSWSSFVNPWSRKVSFVIGRHKVRMGPVNEDVFVAPSVAEGKAMDSDIQEITEQIHRLLLQPVHNNSSSGYGSLGSNDHLMSVASSSDSNGNGARARAEEEEGGRSKPKTFQEICKGVHMLKNQEQQSKRGQIKLTQKNTAVRPKDTAFPVNWRDPLGSPDDPRANVNEELAYKDQTVYSYQQISCLDSVIRYLESCNVPITVKRKCQSSSNTTSSNSDEDKQKGAERAMQASEEASHLKTQSGISPIDVAKKPVGTAVVGTSLAPLALPSKAESVVSITSQCSYSSTIVHVGDKKPQPESEIIEDVAGGGDTAEGPTQAVPTSTISPPSQEREPYKKLGLTKQVLAAHTQKEEQAFLSRFRELRGVHAFKADCSLYLERQKGQVGSGCAPTPRSTKQVGGAEHTTRRGGRNKKTKSKRVKKNESSDSTVSHRKQQPRPPLQGLNQTSWSPSDTSQSTFPITYPAVVPTYPLQMYPGASTVPARVDPSLPGFRDNQCSPDPRCHVQPPPPFSGPLVTPMVALVLPNYVFPQMGATPQQPFYPDQGAFPPQAFPSQTAFPSQPQLQPRPSFPMQTQFAAQNPFTPQTAFPAQPFPFLHPEVPPKAPEPEQREGPSRSSTPQSVGGRDQPSPPLFQSRCSSPLQLNLLQLEETQRSVDRQDSSAPSAGAQGNSTGEKGVSSTSQAKSDKEVQQDADGHQSDALSSSSDLLDILLPEDSHSGTGSATSGSMGSGSNGMSGSAGSASGTGSSHASNNSSNYFGSVDSSQNSHKAKGHGGAGPMEVEESEHFIKYVLQEPMWLLMANVDEGVMMTYQLPPRDKQKVLQEDREKLRQMQKNQPRFTEEQKRELAEVHSWMKRGGLPKVIDVKECVGCVGMSETLTEEDPPDLHMGEVETNEISPPRKTRQDSHQTDTSPCPGPVT
ncbi:period circadian protein homolog 2 isoform X2 [Chanos chanos]|uniref:Period circadian protein homolog 2 n=1 Tax=Chanos chanos TaxID=29144 RepID=A0A6J2V9M9_CHACN|nr:period circadian protein homolog 2 isoform X2 [Chanos chanos]